MALEIHAYRVTTPPNTPIASPQVANLAMPPREVTRVAVIVPPGPRGKVGFALGAAGVPVIPYEPGVFFVADNEKIEYDLEQAITSGAWQLFTYNTGRFPHTLEVRFAVSLPRQPATTASPLLPATLLSSP